MISIRVTVPLIDGSSSPLTPEIKQTVLKVSEKLWPGIPVMPILGVGASDGKYLRKAGLPTYGVSGVFLDVDDFRMHGRDERIRTTDLYNGLEYQYELIRAFSSENS
jgi:acetylornithine deacetylase/succinyl-diaminopimelate desuccinylase-like protein